MDRENRVWLAALARKPEMGNTPSMLDYEARMTAKQKITWGEFVAYVEGHGVREDTVIDCISVSNIKDKITEINVWQVEDNTVLID